ncbi:hypothetical protein VNO80_26528 [Phaseolus coccineus]|uniref:Uncharacterized protein n=1 Tax=Phaseolus coccineus TaxID=3886 RepID=A0AAN9LEX9_PHACN
MSHLHALVPSSLATFFFTMPTFSAFFLFIALFFAAVNAQDFGLPPAPTPDAGAAGSASTSAPVIAALVALSLMIIFKH